MNLIKTTLTLALIALIISAPLVSRAETNPVDKIVSKYQTAPAAEVVAKLKADLSRVKSPEDPAQVEDRLRKQFGDFVLEDARFTGFVWEIIAPVFKFSGKENVYRLLILKTVDPVAFVEDNCVVVLSTGLLMAANSEEAIAGVAAHEQAHGLFMEASGAARRRLEVAQQQGNAASEAQALASINLIEYECDAVAAVQMSATGYNPLRYLDLLDGVGVGVRIDTQRGVYRFEPVGDSPEHQRRAQVIRRLTTPEAAKVCNPPNRLLPLQAAIRRARGEK
jgi:predicted Zn-dependent protease